MTTDAPGPQAAPLAAPPVQYVPAQIQVKPYTGLERVAAVLTLASLVINPFLAPSVLGIVFSAMVLQRMSIARAAGYPVTTRGLMIVTLVVAILSTAVGGYQLLHALTAAGL